MSEGPIVPQMIEVSEGDLEQVRVFSLTLPTGEIVDLADADSCAKALAAVREIEAHVREVKGAIIEALSEEAKRRGENVIELSDGSRVQVKRNYEISWDTEKLENDLMALGMPEERIREIVVQEVTYSVKAVEANKAAKANPEYAKVIESARSETERRPTISIPRS